MRLALDPRARRLLRRLPRNTVYSAMELVLLSLLAVQSARLVWTLVTPLGPIGEWKAGSALRPVAAGTSEILGSFDPFFRLSGGGAQAVVVTSLNLKLFGVREDRASGRGSAIIGTPDGQQKSYAVGEEIMPGVVLTAVGFDNVSVSRGRTAEQLFLDQSGPAPAVAPAFTPAPQVVSTTPPTVMMRTESAPPSPVPDVQVQPRVEGGRVTGVSVQGESLRAAGLQPGDVVTSINGQPIRSAEQARAIVGQLRGGEANVEVERGGRTVAVRVRPGQ